MPAPSSRNATQVDAHSPLTGASAGGSPDPRTHSEGQLIFTEPTWKELAKSLKLSGREFEIVLGVFDDRKEIAIAKQVGISPHTVNTYLQRLYRKLHVGTRAQLITRVFAEYMILYGRQGRDTPRAKAG